MVQVKKRAIFYLSGYDPKGARYYYNLYKSEASKEKSIFVSPKQRSDKHIQSWTIKNTTEEKITDTEYHFLEWDDIVRKNWKKSSYQLLKDWFFYIKVYLLGGLFLKYFIKSHRQMEGIFFPLNYFIVSAGIMYIWSLGFFILLESYALFILLFFFLSWGFFLWATHVGLFWLLRIFVFSAKYTLEDMPNLEKRIDYFAKSLADNLYDAKKNNIDEILIISHSVGSILSIPILSRTLKQVKIDKKIFPTLSVISLGHCIPLVTVIPHSLAYQKEMQYLANQENITWVDYTSVIDTATFPQLNFFEDVNINIKAKENFHFLSPKFHTLYPNKAYKKLKKDKYKAHFLYMMSHPRPRGYNFFRLTSGHQTLKEAIKYA